MYDDDLQPLETTYFVNATEELGQQGEACQTEEVADENKSLIWTLVKQVGPAAHMAHRPVKVIKSQLFLKQSAELLLRPAEKDTCCPLELLHVIALLTNTASNNPYID